MASEQFFEQRSLLSPARKIAQNNMQKIHKTVELTTNRSQKMPAGKIEIGYTNQPSFNHHRLLV
jgi:hypothetical protein